MNRKISHIICSSLICSLALCSCSHEESEESGFADFSLQVKTRVAAMNVAGTRASLLNSGDAIPSNTLQMNAWENSTSWMTGVTATYAAGKWSVPNAETYKLKPLNDYSFLAYANSPSSGASVTLPSSKDGDITFEVTDITSAQSDILLGKAVASKPEDGEVTIEFSHPYASVTFKLGNAKDITEVTAISLTGVYSSGETELSLSSEPDANGVMPYEWTNEGDANATLTETGLSAKEGDEIATFLVIPQDLTEKDAVVTITHDDGKLMTKLLNTGSWEAGYTTTYTLARIGTIAVTIASSDIVSNEGESKIYVRATVTGAWYDGAGNVVAPWDPQTEGFISKLGSNWEAEDGIYYYKDGIASGSSTSKLFDGYDPGTAPVAGAKLKLDILIQAIPYDVNKSCKEAFNAL